MKKTIRAVHIALIVSAVAAVISGISMFIGGFEGTQITIFCCMIAIFFFFLASYSSEKKKKQKKDD
jgi:cytochrome b subunit of formate dehydrogenase